MTCGGESDGDETMIIHAMGPYWCTLCDKSYYHAWEAGHSGVDFAEHRSAINCLKCATEVSKRMDGTSLSVLTLKTRSWKCLREGNIYTVECVQFMSDGELMIMPGFGRGSLRDVREAIETWNNDKWKDYGEFDYYSCYSVG